MRLPLFPTILVIGAVGIMIALGVWQLGRMEEKEALIVRAENALALSAAVDFPRDPVEREALMYRRTTLSCDRVAGVTTVAGTSAAGEKGVAQRVTCILPGGQSVALDLGFSRNPRPVEWGGGDVQGIIAPGGRIVATQAIAGLERLAPPDPRTLPNNHLAYAGQWFFFALTALVIYILALRRRSPRPRAR